MRAAVRGIRETAHPVGLRAVGDPELAAIDDVVAAILAGRRADRGDVGAGAGLGHADARHHFARDRRHEEFTLQLGVADPRERRCRHVRLHADRERHAAAGAGAERFGQHDGVAVIECRTTGGLGFGEPQQAELPELAKDVVRGERAGILPGIDVRIEFFAAEPLDGAAQLCVFVGK